MDWGELFSQVLPILLTAAAGLIGWLVFRLEAVVKASKTDIDDKIFNALKKAIVDLDGQAPEKKPEE